MSGAHQLDLLFEYGDAAALDTEHAEEIIPEALRLGRLGGLAFPLAREGERVALDLVPGKRHVRPPASARRRAATWWRFQWLGISLGQGQNRDACRAS
jgi:hypothetical protein